MSAETKNSLPPLPWSGSCQCAQVRYELSAYPLTFYCCHCTECQKQAASMHGESLLVHFDALKLTGETRKWSRKTDSGNTTDCHFCPDCGTRLYHRGTHREEADRIVTLKGGTLQQISKLEPVGHIWMKSAQPGFRCDPSAILYDRQPESYQPLIDAFLKRYGTIDINQ